MRRLRMVAGVLMSCGLWICLQPGQALAAPVLMSLTLPPTAAAGDTVHVAAVVQAPGVGVQSAALTLVGPSDQRLSTVLVRRPGTDEVVADWTLSPFLQAGHWRVAELTLFDNDGGTVTLTGDGQAAAPAPQHAIQIRGGGGDLRPAQVRDLRVTPRRVVTGDRFTLGVQVSAPPAGVQEVEAYVSDTRGDVEPRFYDVVRLHFNASTGLWEGTTLAPIIGPRAQPLMLFVRSVRTRSRAGVEKTYWCGPFANPLPGVCTFEVLPVQARPELRTVPELDLFHAGRLDFFAWSGQDAEYLSGLFQRLQAEPEEIRQIVAGQLPALSTALNAVTAEIYYDPATDIRISTPNTSGKFLALSWAVRGRLLLLAELDRRAARAAGPALTVNELRKTLLARSPYPAKPAPREVYDGAGALITERYLEVLQASPLPAPVWSLAMAQDWDNLQDMTLVAGVIWVVPLNIGGLDGLHHTSDSTAGIWLDLPDQLPASLAFAIPLHELGHRFHDVFLGGSGQEPSPLWQEYLSLRGGQVWHDSQSIGHNGRPEENFAEDFAQTYLPSELAGQRSVRYMYPRLQENPKMRSAFGQFVAKVAQQPAQSALQVTAPAGKLVVTAPGALVLSGSWRPGHEVRVWRQALSVDGLNGGVGPTTYAGSQTSGDDGRWQMPVPAAGPGPQVLWLVGIDEKGQGIHIRRLIVFASGLRLDALPLTTSAASFVVSGTAAPRAQVTVAGQTVAADNDGRFKVQVRLQPGPNRLRVSTDTSGGQQAGAVVEVNRQA